VTGGSAAAADNGTLVNDEAPDLRSGAATARPTRKTTAAMGEMTLFLPLIIILGAFMFFASRRQKKAMQATIDLHDSLKEGDRVHTTSGLQGTIAAITDDNVDLEIAPGVITTWMKLAVRDRIVDDIDEDVDDTDTAADADYEARESKAIEITESPNTKTDG
jgi:preprotein translocase subunit YajC